MDILQEHLKWEGTCEISRTLTHNTKLASLDLEGQELGRSGAKELASSLAESTSLTHLNLWGNKIGRDGASFIATSLLSNTSLCSLNLEWNDLGCEGAKDLAHCLSKNSSLTVLQLGWNGIGKRGASELAGALSSPECRLVSLNLKGNRIGREGMEAIAASLCKNTRLQVLNLSANSERWDPSADKKRLMRLLRYNISLTCLEVDCKKKPGPGAFLCSPPCAEPPSASAWNAAGPALVAPGSAIIANVAAGGGISPVPTSVAVPKYVRALMERNVALQRDGVHVIQTPRKDALLREKKAKRKMTLPSMNWPTTAGRTAAAQLQADVMKELSPSLAQRHAVVLSAICYNREPSIRGSQRDQAPSPMLASALAESGGEAVVGPGPGPSSPLGYDEFSVLLQTKVDRHVEKLLLRNIYRIPMAIVEFHHLRVLDVSCNHLNSLPSELPALINLRRLIARNNNIHTLPVKLRFMDLLEKVDLRDNPFDFIALPNDVSKHDKFFRNRSEVEELFEVLRELEKGKTVQNDVKLMFCGEGRVGKTSLLYCFQDKAIGGIMGLLTMRSSLKRREAKQTDGVDITSLQLKGITFDCWDFAGQELYYITHQVFPHIWRNLVVY